ncbi:uncharacterized protein [Lepisosteus oculatus]|uniref:uncharacterized protein isoform X2 n=1 Tax=Lepisosteus oculatus TaxID=7918 RepID=UPI00372370BA
MDANKKADGRRGNELEECVSKKRPTFFGPNQSTLGSSADSKQDQPHGSGSPDMSRSRRPRKKRETFLGEEISPKRGKKSGWAGRATGDSKDFCCDLCRSPFITNPTRRGNKSKAPRSGPARPRRRADPRTGETLVLCNACGLSYGKPKCSKPADPIVEPSDRARHEQELEAFAQSMVELLGDQDAKRLACPVYWKKPCLCIQSHIKGTGDAEDGCHSRALQILALLKEAKVLSTQKCYDLSTVQLQGKMKKPVVGLGNGQRKSREFEEFVLTNRKVLREELKLCERACQRILGYSNNFLHKRLITDPQKKERIERTKGKRTLGLLKPITDLWKNRCCLDNCVVMAHTHWQLLQDWRERARSGQAEARRVLAEMLTPSGGGRCNCYKFIMWVTGCSQSTISKVSDQMKKTGGKREPPPHGLKKWIKDNPRPKKKVAKAGPPFLLTSLPQPSAGLPMTGPEQGLISAAVTAGMTSESAVYNIPLCSPGHTRPEEGMQNILLTAVTGDGQASFHKSCPQSPMLEFHQCPGQPLSVPSQRPTLLVQKGPSACVPHDTPVATPTPHTLATMATCSLMSGATQLILQGIEHGGTEGTDKLAPGSLESVAALQSQPHVLNAENNLSPLAQASGMGMAQLPTGTLPLTSHSAGLKGTLKPPMAPMENQYLLSSEEDHSVLWAP